MRFQPKSENEIQSMNLLTEGKYPFEVIEAKDCLSKKTNAEQIKITLKVWDNSGRERLIDDYLNPAMAHKLRHFSVVTGLVDKYDLGEIRDIDCVGKTGEVQIIIEKGKQKEDGSYYHDKNSVKDYLVKSKSNFIPIENNFKDDEIPF